MSKNIPYNGWANYETWRVNLEMIDGLNPIDMGWKSLDRYELANVLKEFCVEILESETAHKGASVSLALSYALAFLDMVDWFEIAEHMIDAYEMEPEQD